MKAIRNWLAEKPVDGTVISTGAQLKSALRDCGYEHCSEVEREILEVLASFKGLSIIVDTYVSNIGDEKQMICLDGTIPVQYKGQFYNVPIRFWFSLAHPSYPPLVQVKPTPSMSINVGTNIDSAGVVKSRYLEKWNRETSDLACLIQILCAEFSERIPVYSIPVRRDSGEAFFECRSSRETGRPSAVTGTHSTESDKTSASTGTSSELISSRKMETPSAATGAPSTAPGAPSTAPGATSIATGTPSMASIGRGLPSEATFKDSNEARSASVEASTTSSDIYTKRREALKLIANDLLQKTLILSDQTESLLRVLETSRDELDEETLSIRCLDRLESEIETVEEWEKSLEKKLEENAVLTEAFRKDVEKFNTPRVNRKPYQEWTNDDVCRWFHEIGMGEYAPALREHKIKGIHLPNLSKDDLIELGITKLGPRVTVDEQINKLCNDFSNIM
ncbi:tumor susceptibility gene 101 protein-like [Rhopilema esculentum]|uniref:tumor susceptibility gene 101 protein-like n=1 Tax=Rhopilema esculentum TaxID=499914 RepID=UPI0031DEC1F9